MISDIDQVLTNIVRLQHIVKAVRVGCWDDILKDVNLRLLFGTHCLSCQLLRRCFQAITSKIISEKYDKI
jgi:hypothetical protein